MSLSLNADIEAFHQATILLTAFATAVDAGDCDSLERMFAPDAVFDLPSLEAPKGRQVLRGRDEILARWRGERPFASRHIIGNVTARLKNSDHMEVRSTGFGMRGPEDGGSPFLIVVADYEDDLERHGSGWRFRSRIVNSVFTWSAEKK